MQSNVFHTQPAAVVRVTGKDRIDLLHRLSTRDLRPLKDSERAASTLFTTHQGKLIDWVFVLSRPDHLVLHASAGRAETLAGWIRKYTIMEDVVATPEPDATMVTVWAPGDALGLNDSAAPDSVQGVGQGLWRRGLMALGSIGTETANRIGGPQGDPAGRVAPWVGILPAAAARACVEQLQKKGFVALPDDAMERRRIEAGVPSPTYEYKEEVNPLELRLVNVAVSWNKGCYIGQEVISRLDSYDKVARLTIGFVTDEPGILLGEGEAKLTRDGRPLGRVTSSITQGGITVGIALVKREAATPGSATLEVSGAAHPVTLRDCAFWENSLQ